MTHSGGTAGKLSLFTFDWKHNSTFVPVKESFFHVLLIGSILFNIAQVGWRPIGVDSCCVAAEEKYQMRSLWLINRAKPHSAAIYEP